MTTKRYGEQIAEQMQRVRAAITRGETKIRFSCKVGRHLLHRDIDVSSAENQSTVDRMLYAHCQALIKEALDLDAMEMLKVAQCPKCRAWFPTFEERNEHRATHQTRTGPDGTVYQVIAEQVGDFTVLHDAKTQRFIGTANELRQEV